jgi:hypothetical protein
VREEGEGVREEGREGGEGRREEREGGRDEGRERGMKEVMREGGRIPYM